MYIGTFYVWCLCILYKINLHILFTMISSVLKTTICISISMTCSGIIWNLDQHHVPPHHQPPHRVHSSYQSASLDHVHDVPLNLMSVSVKPPPCPLQSIPPYTDVCVTWMSCR